MPLAVHSRALHCLHSRRSPYRYPPRRRAALRPQPFERRESVAVGGTYSSWLILDPRYLRHARTIGLTVCGKIPRGAAGERVPEIDRQRARRRQGGAPTHAAAALRCDALEAGAACVRGGGGAHWLSSILSSSFCDRRRFVSSMSRARPSSSPWYLVINSSSAPHTRNVLGAMTFEQSSQMSRASAAPRDSPRPPAPPASASGVVARKAPPARTRRVRLVRGEGRGVSS